MTSIDYNNTRPVDTLRELDETGLEITSEYVELWDVGREAIVGAWVDSTGKIAEIVDETTREAESGLALNGFLCGF